MQLAVALLLRRPYRHKAHGRASYRLADHFGVGGVVLVTLNVGLPILGWDQPDLVPQLDQLTTPMVGTAAGLQRRQRAAVPSAQRPASADAGGPCISAVHLEPVLCHVEPDSRNLRHGQPPQVVVLTPGTMMPQAGTDHPNGAADHGGSCHASSHLRVPSTTNSADGDDAACGSGSTPCRAARPVGLPGVQPTRTPQSSTHPWSRRDQG